MSDTQEKVDNELLEHQIFGDDENEQQKQPENIAENEQEEQDDTAEQEEQESVTKDGEENEEEQAEAVDEDEAEEHNEAQNDGEQEEQEDEQQEGQQPKSLPSFHRREHVEGGSDDDEDGDGPGEEEQRKKKRRERNKQQDERQQQDESETPLDPAEQRKLDLNARIDSIIKPPKSNRRKRRKAADDDLGDMADEEEAAQLRQNMLNAVRDDIDANSQSMPATSKLIMLPTVTSMLQKTHLESVFIDTNVYGAVKQWLEPLPDKSLPALNIQRELFSALLKTNLDSQALRESELGRIVLFYTKCKRVDPSIKRMADTLIMNWMRPILNKSNAYQTGPKVRQATQDDVRRGAGRTRYKSVTHAPGIARQDTYSKRTGVPQPITKTFTVAPMNRIEDAESATHSTRTANTTRKYREFKKKLAAGNSRT